MKSLTFQSAVCILSLSSVMALAQETELPKRRFCGVINVSVGSENVNSKAITGLFHEDESSGEIGQDLESYFNENSCLRFLFETPDFTHFIGSSITLDKSSNKEDKYFNATESLLRKEVSTSSECADIGAKALGERYKCYHSKDYQNINGFYSDNKSFKDGLRALVSTAFEAYAYNPYQINKVLLSTGLIEVHNKVKQGLFVNSQSQLGEVVLLASGYRASLTQVDFWQKSEITDEDAVKVLKASSFLTKQDLAYAYGELVKLSTFKDPAFFIHREPSLITGLLSAMSKAGFQYENGDWK